MAIRRPASPPSRPIEELARESPLLFEPADMDRSRRSEGMAAATLPELSVE